MSLVDLLREAGGWAGASGAAVLAEIYRRFRSAEKSAKAAQSEISKLRKQFEETKAAMRLELDTFKATIEERVERRRSDPPARPSRPDLFLEDIRRDEHMRRDELRRLERDLKVEVEKELDTRVERALEGVRGELKRLSDELLRDRGQRHALEKAFNDYMREAGKSWQELQRDVGWILGVLRRDKK